jgi:hypothetical protein
MVRTDQSVLNLDCMNLHAFNPELYDNLVKYPQEIIPILDAVAADVRNGMLELPGIEWPEGARNRRIEVRPYNLRSIKSMRELNPDGSLSSSLTPDPNLPRSNSYKIFFIGWLRYRYTRFDQGYGCTLHTNRPGFTDCVLRVHRVQARR